MEDSWRDDLLKKYPYWGDHSHKIYQNVSYENISVGDYIEGVVIAVAHFGVWLDVKQNFPGLLLIVNIKAPNPLTESDLPKIGQRVKGKVYLLSNNGEIGITQKESEYETTLPVT